MQSKGWTTFDEMQTDRKALKADYETMEKNRSDMTERMSYLQKLLDYNDEYYEPYHKYNIEYWKLKGAEDKNGKPLGFFKKSQAEEYKKQHQSQLTTFKMYKSALKDMIEEPDKKINPKAGKKELDGLKEKYQQTERPMADAIINLAKMEVLSYNKRYLEQTLQNERSAREKNHSRDYNQSL